MGWRVADAGRALVAARVDRVRDARAAEVVEGLPRPARRDADREAGRLEAALEADDPFAASVEGVDARRVLFRAAQRCSMIDANGVSAIGITSAVREAFEPQRRV